MSDKNPEQRINFKFWLEIGKGASETLALLTVAYGEYAMKKWSVFQWHGRFKEGRENVHYDPRSGLPTMQSTDYITLKLSSHLIENKMQQHYKEKILGNTI